jgi:hypothetical protein
MTRTMPDADRDTLRAAQRAWFRAGVRRADRHRRIADLAFELEGARSAGGPATILGADPAQAAREWAEAQGLTDRRSRIGLLAPPMVLAGAVASGCVLAPVLQAFSNGGHSFLDRVGGAGTLAIYCGAGFLAYLSMLAVAVAMLSVVNDAQRSRTVRVLSGALPLGAAIACAGGIAAAATLHFDVRPRTFTIVGVVVAAVMIATIGLARAVITRHQPTQEASDSATAVDRQ